MDNIEWFFNLHDKNKDGFLTKDEVLTVSESLLVCGLSCGMEQTLDFSLSSSFSDLKLAMRTWVLLAASCLTHLSMVTPSYLDLKERTKRAVKRLK
jgi:EF-hand domain